MRWTDQEEVVLRKCIEKNLNMPQIQSVFKGRTKDSIWNKMNSLGLRLNVKPPEMDLDAFKEFTGEVLEI
jgi:hypothetical protein